MRGKGFCQALRGFPAGITPAYAGKRRTATGYRSAAQDHPRVCGEKREPPRASSSKYGSPPRMRGKVIKRPVCVRVLGITPAYAGKSIGDACPEKAVKDHPRICGEKLYAMKPARAGKGSPPHMRGKDWAACCAAGISGITPAYAGKRVRMKAPLDSTVGITPAYAGKSGSSLSWRMLLWDHPRICGEKDSTSPQGNTAAGSPPHMRGKVENTAQKQNDRRITPAYAGKRSHAPLRCTLPWDHPRICGEK